MKLVIDTETTGLFPWNGDSAFLLGISEIGEDLRQKRTLIYNLRDIGQVELAKDQIVQAKLLIGHNIKFDLAFLRKIGFTWSARLWDTLVMERIRYNDHLSYSLEECGSRIGVQKDTRMGEYLKAHKLYGRDHLGDRKPLFEQVPPETMLPYLEKDLAVTAALYKVQVETFKQWDQTNHPIKQLVSLEMDTTAHLFEMECTGMLIDQNYCHQAVDHINREIFRIELELHKIFGTAFTDSAKFLTPHFDRLHLRYGRTEKGNASFKDECLDSSSPVTKLILDRRHLQKMKTSYFENFIAMIGSDGRVHGNFKQAGAATGRMSITNPALQTIPTEDNFAYPIRRAFVAPEGYKILSLDYSNMELRVMADQAGATRMIEAFEKGTDFHQMVADLAKVPRQVAKSALFAKVYGAGVPKIAATLGVPEHVARSAVDAINSIAPELNAFSYGMTRYLETAPYAPGWSGRRYFFHDKNFTYKIGNYLIQGGASDVMRYAIKNCKRAIQDVAGVKILTTIHDELVFEIRDDLVKVVTPILARAMEDAYLAKKRLPMKASAAIGTNFHDLDEYEISA